MFVFLCVCAYAEMHALHFDETHGTLPMHLRAEQHTAPAIRMCSLVLPGQHQCSTLRHSPSSSVMLHCSPLIISTKAFFVSAWRIHFHCHRDGAGFPSNLWLVSFSILKWHLMSFILYFPSFSHHFLVLFNFISNCLLFFLFFSFGKCYSYYQQHCFGYTDTPQQYPLSITENKCLVD